MNTVVKIDDVLAMMGAGATLQEMCDWLLACKADEAPTRFMLDMDGSMVPDPEGEWVRYES